MQKFGLSWIKLHLHGNSSIGYSLQFIQLNYIKMEHILCSDRLNIEPNATDAEKNTDIGKSHWTILLMNTKTTFPNKLCCLIKYVSVSIYEFISSCAAFESAIDILDRFFIKRKKTIFAPSSCHVRDWKYWWIPPGTMQTAQSLPTYGCYCWTEYHQELVWDAFINGLTFHEIWQHLLESQVQTLNQAYDIASALEHDQHNSKDCITVTTLVNDALHTEKTFSILMAAMFCKWILLL